MKLVKDFFVDNLIIGTDTEDYTSQIYFQRQSFKKWQ